MNIEIAFLLTSLAGLSTLIGTLLIFIKKDNKIIIKSLSFAAGVMITVSIIDLIPESISLLHLTFKIFPTILLTFIFICIGVILSMIIDKHVSPKREGELYKIGIISMLAIILHNIPEGIMTFVSTNTNLKLGLSLTIAIALHNIPEGISISIPIYHATKSKKKAFFYTLISGISEPCGAIIAYLFLSNIMNNVILGFILSVTAGIMIQISFYELLPTSFNYKNKRLTIIFFAIGILFMSINHLIFG